MLRRRFADLLLFCVTLTELVILFRLTPTFGVADWIYILQHLIVLGVALARPRPRVRDYSMPTSIAVAISYAYPYAQVIYLRWLPGEEAWPAGGLVLVTLAAGLSFLSLLTIRRRFGVRPALRGLVTSGPYRFVRHPMYLFVRTWGHRLQPGGMEFRDSPSGVDRLGVSHLPHPRRGASNLSRCRMAGLSHPRSLPPFARSLVKAPLPSDHTPRAACDRLRLRSNIRPSADCNKIT